jgi:hypothetical protein
LSVDHRKVDLKRIAQRGSRIKGNKMNTQQDHKVRFDYIAKMYRVNANCKCGWSKDYTIATETSEIELTELHDAFVKVGA